MTELRTWQGQTTELGTGGGLLNALGGWAHTWVY